MIDVTLYTDPACPFAFSAEPVRLRLRWQYGDALRWENRMIVLTLEPGEAEKLAAGAGGLQKRYGMPIDPRPLARPASCEPACAAVVAARLHAASGPERLLRALRVRTMAGGLLDDPALLNAAARDAGLDPEQLAGWIARADTQAALREDVGAARQPSEAARALDHKLGGPEHARRYTAPSYELRVGDRSACVPGFNPFGTYETTIANLDPSLPRRPPPESVSELLAWSDVPLATVEVVEIMQRDVAELHAELAHEARAIPAGAGVYWSARG